MTTNARWTPEHYQGRNYYTTVYRQFVLFPQQSGKLYIDPAQFQMTIGKPVQSDDPFDAFFNGGSNVIEIKKNISTPKIAINVNPLLRVNLQIFRWSGRVQYIFFYQQ